MILQIMVKVVPRTDKEKALEEKVKGLKEITKQAIKDKRKIFNYVGTSRNLRNLIYIRNYNFFTLFMSYAADCSDNSISIDKPKHYDFAFELVKRYQEHTGEEWTLKKEYDE